MRNTCATAAAAALRQRVFLFTPAATVCVVVCVPRMTCVTTHVGRSDELWRFSTSTRGWERVDNISSNVAGPSARSGHVMTSVGLDLWVHGGYTDSGKGDGRMRNTRDTTAAAVLGQRECLLSLLLH